MIPTDVLPQTLATRYQSVRDQTEALASVLSTEDQVVQSMPDVSPTKWHRAHVTWFFETFVLLPNVAGHKPVEEYYGYLFNSYYEAVGDRQPRATRGLVTRPTGDEVAEYRRRVDESTHRLMAIHGRRRRRELALRWVAHRAVSGLGRSALLEPNGGWLGDPHLERIAAGRLERTRRACELPRSGRLRPLGGCATADRIRMGGPRGRPGDRGHLLPAGHLHPIRAAGAGLRQMFGDVLEWTGSAYSAYPGFSPAEGAVGEYNGKFMIDQQVLRGGACVAPGGHVRPTYRNFFPARARWMFGGVRLATDAGSPQ